MFYVRLWLKEGNGLERLLMRIVIMWAGVPCPVLHLMEQR
jgi:hypothetical protein